MAGPEPYSVERLLISLKEVAQATKDKADRLYSKGESADIAVHQCISEISDIRESFDRDVLGGLLSAMSEIEMSLENDVQDEIQGTIDIAQEIQEEVDELKLKLERLRLGVLGRLNNVIDYLEGVAHDDPNIAGAFKADVKRMESAKIDAWEVHDIVAETDAKRKTLVNDLKEATDEMGS
mgnify:CR=1 FL=1